MRVWMVLVVLAAGGWAMAQEHGALDAQPHPVIVEPANWPGIMVIVVLGLFLAAACVGVMARANHTDDPPPLTHSYDEPPGTSHHHGDSGAAPGHLHH